ncbi:MAG: hypothetical protein BWY09_02755 [Candidatus Hydrogenedentes bacterium ADurb.Bin179]|nr:MAG: hypothetical protein BWY09_02755 [Candidatus Hydrogenedentes bacterium ADurb.Bin179]
MQVFRARAEFRADAVEAQFHVRLLEGKGVCLLNGLAVLYPFVHTPELCVQRSEVEVEGVYQSCDQWQLFRRADGTANACRVVRGGCAPGFNVLQGLGKIKIFQRFMKNNLETRSGQLGQVFFR